jgi:putative ABC transport system permease protein
MRRQRDDDLDRELRTHLEIEAEDQRDAGLNAADARDAARRLLGNTTAVREEVYLMSKWAALDALAQDVRYGLRLLRKHPGFTLVAALTLALGVGANTAMFSVVEAVLLRPLPFPQADRLVMVWENVNLPAYKNDQNTPSPGNFNEWRTQSTAFTGMAAIGYRAWNLTGAGDPIRIAGEAVSAELFPLLGVEPLLGRTFTADEDRAGGPSVAMLGFGLWTERFGADPAIVGKTIRLDDAPYTVVGVLPRGFAFPDPDDRLWVPIALTPQQLQNRGSHFLRVVGRLKPGVTVAQAQGELDGIAARLTKQYPNSNTGVGVRVMSLREQRVGQVQTPLLLLLAIVGFVLLMVCANIGNLLLARASARERELAVRAAIGATGGRLLRQLLTETLLLALIGGAAGLALAAWGVTALRWLAPASLPQATDLSVNGVVGLFNFAVASVAGLVCGIAPAWQAKRGDLHEALKADARGASHRSGTRARGALIVAETALGVIVLVGAGLLLRSFWQLEHVALGFKTDRVLTFRMVLPPARYATPLARAAFYRQAIDRLSAAPGVQSAAGITFLPLTMAGRTTGINVEGDPPPLPGQVKFVDFRSITPGYFSAVAIPFQSGRDIAWSDNGDRPPVIVISDAAARAFWPGRDPIGKRIKLGPSNDNSIPWITVVGVVGNVQQLDLVRQPRPAIYLSAAQDVVTGDTLRDWVVRANGSDPGALAPDARAAIRAIDPTLPLTRVQTFEQIRSTALAREQFTLLLVGLFAVLALILAAVGLYGVTAFAVAQRTRELGIRVALGAGPGDVVRLVLKLGGRLVATGLIIGLAIALALSQLMSTMLFGVGARDPMTFAVVALVLATVSLVACYLPARRALRLDPVAALRT